MPTAARQPWPTRPRLPAPGWLLLLLTLAANLPAAAQPAPPARVLPPADIECPPDHLTLYGGQVQHYRRSAGRTELRLHTDWGTDETVVILHPGSDDPSRWFLIGRQPFQAADWPRIESSPGRLHDGLRAAAWVCDDGRNPRVDWQPPKLR